MDKRSLDKSKHRPLPAQRVGSKSGSLHHNSPAQNGASSRLGATKSTLQPADVIDLSCDTIVVKPTTTVPLLAKHDSPEPSREVIEVEDDAPGPPAKRTKTEGDGSRADDISPSNSAPEGPKDKAHERLPGSPLPMLPRKTPRKLRARKNRGRNQKDEPARRAHGTEPPSMGVRIPNPKGVADFFPYTGRNHSEDTMNETVVKSGHCDKSPGTHSPETSSARQSLWPSLSQKNNTGLQMVAYLFTQVLEKRQALGKCTAPPTFKPPPRVTVTDTRREAWLRDLANLDMPLRKHSRTIPHGVRGKGLLDQCLGKQIPLHRSVWLAKCVGANELRAFRRKGVSGSAATSGEAKWVREWTVQIEQFLDAAILNCGEPGWQQKIDYAIKLATSFFVEKLMDTDHYLDWIVTSFGGAPMERLPIWILIVQLYWKDLTSYVKRGRKLAEHSLDRFHLLGSNADTAGKAMQLQLQNLITILATTRRGCLVVPAKWAKFEHVFASRTSPTTVNARSLILKDVSRRNGRLTELLRKTATNTRSKVLDSCSSLDNVGLNYNIASVTAQLQSFTPDISELVSTVFNWASSPHRQGQYRIYLAASIIKQLHTSGHDTDASILAYLCTPSDATMQHADNVHRVIADLVRRQAFSLGKYLRWLISSGVLYDESNSKCATDLLAVLPMDLFASDSQNTRATLLRRLGLEDLGETHHPLDGVDLKAILDGEDEDLTPLEALTGGLTLLTKTQIATEIRHAIHQHNKKSRISTAAFCAFRSALEHVEDPPTLLELVVLAMAADDTTLLSSVADTISTQARAFAALGQLNELADQMTSRYLTLRSAQAQDRAFISGMFALATHIPRRTQLQKLTANDLTVYDQQSLLTACSPASDSLTSMHAPNLASEEDIDAVFASGNTMDSQLMQRVFLRIVHVAKKRSDPPLGVPSKLCSWFGQLRLLDPFGFKQLAKTYLHDVFQSPSAGIASMDAITALVASSCCSMTEIVEAAREASSLPAAALVMDLILAGENAGAKLSEVERYRYKAVAQAFRDSEYKALAEFVYDMLKDSSEDASPSMTQTLVRYFKHDILARNDFMERSKRNPKMQPQVDRLFMAILQSVPPYHDHNVPDFGMIISQSDPFSIDLCTRIIRKHVTDMDTLAQESRKALAEVLIKTIDDGNCVWPQLVESMDDRTRRILHEWAQDQLLVYATGSGFEEDAAIREIIQRYFDVIGITHSSVKDEDDTHLIMTLVEKLKGVAKRLHYMKSTSRYDNDLRDVVRSLELFLNVCVVPVHKIAEHETPRQARGDLLLALCSLLNLSRLQRQRDTLDFLYDLAASLAAALPETSFGHTARAGLKSLSHDPRVASILGAIFVPSSQTETWLVLATPPQMAAQSSQQHPQRSATFTKPTLRPAVSSPSQLQKPSLGRSAGVALSEPKITPFALRRWEIMSDATPIMGENDAGLSLSLFAARKV
nr:mediator of rna polymerase ii transcription subunit 12 [Quercus suber]